MFSLADHDCATKLPADSKGASLLRVVRDQMRRTTIVHQLQSLSGTETRQTGVYSSGLDGTIFYLCDKLLALCQPPNNCSNF